jgi:hypothetical protein
LIVISFIIITAHGTWLIFKNVFFVFCLQVQAEEVEEDEDQEQVSAGLFSFGTRRIKARAQSEGRTQEIAASERAAEARAAAEEKRQQQEEARAAAAEERRRRQEEAQRARAEAAEAARRKQVMRVGFSALGPATASVPVFAASYKQRHAPVLFRMASISAAGGRGRHN